MRPIESVEKWPTSLAFHQASYFFLFLFMKKSSNSFYSLEWNPTLYSLSSQNYEFYTKNLNQARSRWFAYYLINDILHFISHNILKLNGTKFFLNLNPQPQVQVDYKLNAFNDSAMFLSDHHLTFARWIHQSPSDRWSSVRAWIVPGWVAIEDSGPVSLGELKAQQKKWNM